jgi:hypothetical protein
MKNIEFALVKIQTVQFAVTPEVLKPKLKVRFSYGLTFNSIKEKHLIVCTFKSKFLQKETPFIQLEISCGFQLSPESWKELSTETKISIPKGFAEHLAVLTVGTSRGILHSKTESTDFNKFIMPTLDVRKLIKEDISFEFKK